MARFLERLSPTIHIAVYRDKVVFSFDGTRISLEPYVYFVADKRKIVSIGEAPPVSDAIKICLFEADKGEIVPKLDILTHFLSYGHAKILHQSSASTMMGLSLSRAVIEIAQDFKGTFLGYERDILRYAALSARFQRVFFEGQVS